MIGDIIDQIEENWTYEAGKALILLEEYSIVDIDDETLYEDFTIPAVRYTL